MDIQTAVMFFYLLLPAPDSRQTDLLLKMNKNMPSGQARIAISRELNALLYEENDLLPLSDEFYNEDFSLVLPKELEESRDVQVQENSPAELLFKTSKNSLKLFEYGEERFSNGKTPSQQYSFVSANEKYIVRRIYDSEFRLQEKTLWKNGTTLDSILLENTEQYSYTNDGNFQLKHINIESKTNNSRLETDFDSNGNAIFTSYYSLDEKGKKNLKKNRKYEYDAENRLISDEEIVFFEIADPLRRGKTKPAQSSHKTEYAYTDLSAEPDTIYYEDGVLRLTVSYISSESYEQTVYFEDDYMVKTIYESGVKREESVYSGGILIMRRTFDE